RTPSSRRASAIAGERANKLQQGAGKGRTAPARRGLGELEQRLAGADHEVGILGGDAVLGDPGVLLGEVGDRGLAEDVVKAVRWPGGDEVVVPGALEERPSALAAQAVAGAQLGQLRGGEARQPGLERGDGLGQQREVGGAEWLEEHVHALEVAGSAVTEL